MGSVVKRELLLGVGAVALVGLGLLLGDYMRLREEVSKDTEVKVTVPKIEKDEPKDLIEPLSKITVEARPTFTSQSKKPAFNSDFEEFTVPSFNGSAKPLRMTSDQRYYRTRLMEAYASPPDYGGSLVIAQIGCGTGCRTVYALDKSSGKVIDFPLGGEANMYLWIRYREDSSLIWATWEDSYPSDCKAQPWNLGASGFVPLSEPVGINCDVARDSN